MGEIDCQMQAARRWCTPPGLQSLPVYSRCVRAYSAPTQSDLMKPTHPLFNPFTCVLRGLAMLALLAAIGVMPAAADEYSDMSQLMRSGKPAEALKKIELHLATKPRDPQMRFFKGLIQRDAGQAGEAIATFTALTEEYPELPEPYNNLAVLFASQNQFEKARAALEMAIKTNPAYAVAYENLGDVHARLASQAYDKALQLDTGSASVPPKLALVRELFGPTAKPPATGTIPVK